MLSTQLNGGSITKYRPIGHDGEPIYKNAEAFIAALKLQPSVGVEKTNCLAVPRVSADGLNIDWYVPFSPRNPSGEHQVVSWNSASPQEQQQAMAILNNLEQSLRKLGNELQRRGAEGQSKLMASYLTGQKSSQNLPAIHFPGPEFVYIVDGIPVITFWGFESGSDDLTRSPLDILRNPVPNYVPPQNPAANGFVGAGAGGLGAGAGAGAFVAPAGGMGAGMPPENPNNQNNRSGGFGFPMWLLWLLLGLLLLLLLWWLLPLLWGLLAGLFGFGGGGGGLNLPASNGSAPKAVEEHVVNTPQSDFVPDNHNTVVVDAPRTLVPDNSTNVVVEDPGTVIMPGDTSNVTVHEGDSVVGPDLNISGPNLPDVNLPDVSLTAPNLPDVNLPNVSLNGSGLPDIDLPNVSLSGDLPNVNLPDVGLSGGNLPDVNLANAGLVFNGLDLDNDGLFDAVDINNDQQADGIASDADNDGVLDIAGFDFNKDNKIEGFGIDSNGDNKLDSIAIDANGDGNIDGLDTNGDGVIDIPLDTAQSPADVALEGEQDVALADAVAPTQDPTQVDTQGVAQDDGQIEPPLFVPPEIDTEALNKANQSGEAVAENALAPNAGQAPTDSAMQAEQSATQAGQTGKPAQQAEDTPSAQAAAGAPMGELNPLTAAGNNAGQNQAEPKQASSNQNISFTPQAVQTQGVRVVNGQWSTRSALMDSANGRPLQLGYTVKDGQGQVQITRFDGSKCVAQVKAVTSGSGIKLDASGNAVCPDNTSYQIPNIECSADNTGLVRCTGKSNNTTFPIQLYKAQ